MVITNSFTHDGNIYDLDIVRKLLRERLGFLLPLSELEWVLDYDTPDEDRVLKAKHRYPLIVTQWARGKTRQWCVVDGLHRLEKYRRKGIKIIPVIEATPDILEKALIHPR